MLTLFLALLAVAVFGTVGTLVFFVERLARKTGEIEVRLSALEGDRVVDSHEASFHRDFDDV